MSNNTKRDIVLIIIGLAFVLLGGMCSSKRATAANAPAQVPVQFYELRAGLETVTYLYTTDPNSIKAVRYDGTCLAEAAGVWYRNEDNEVVIVPLHHGSITLDGATAYTGDNLGGGRVVAGAWFRFRYAWAGAGGAGTGGPGGYNLRRDALPLGAMHDDKQWEWPNLVQCVSGPFLPLITAGPADGGFIAFVALCVLGIFALRSNRRPTPPEK